MAAVPARATCLREHFEVTAESKNGSHKQTYCLSCVDKRINEILDADRKAVEERERDSVRPYAEARALGVLRSYAVCVFLD